MRQLVFALSVGLLLAFAGPMTSQAQSFKVGPRLTVSAGDISDSGGDIGIGANARVGFPGVPVDGDAAFTYFFADDPLTIWTFDVNALYSLPVTGPVSPYVGGGLGITRSSAGGFSNTDTALNILGGVEFSAGGFSPFAELNITAGGDVSRLGITGGLLFGF